MDKVTIITKKIDKSFSLEKCLRVIQPFLDDERNTEIVINQPGQVLTESSSGWHYHDVPALDYTACFNIAKLTATYSDQTLSESKPILSATLPKGERIQIVMPPATRSQHISMTIRKPALESFTLGDYRKQGFFEPCNDAPPVNTSSHLSKAEQELVALKNAGKVEAFLELAVASRLNIIVSGSTGSGKTTFMRTLVKLVDQSERLISIENVDELGLYKTHKNTVPLFYSAGGQGMSEITQQHLLESSLRMKPDRIFVAELIRGDEAFYYLRNVNSGHPGSITSMHANSAHLAIEQLVLFLKESKSGSSLSRSDIKQLLLKSVDIIIQIKRIKGKRVITEIEFNPEKKRQEMASGH